MESSSEADPLCIFRGRFWFSSRNYCYPYIGAVIAFKLIIVSREIVHCEECCLNAEFELILLFFHALNIKAPTEQQVTKWSKLVSFGLENTQHPKETVLRSSVCAAFFPKKYVTVTVYCAVKCEVSREPLPVLC